MALIRVFLFMACGLLLASSEPDSLITKHLVRAAEAEVPLLAARSNAETDVLFLLYTKNNPSSAKYISVGDATSLSNFNTQHSTKVIAHGWLNSPQSIDTIRAAYMESGEDINVIMVDWSKVASNLVYAEVKERVPSVGESVAALLEFLISKGLSLTNIHLVGHSLGAHVVGVAGNRVKSGSVGRITGLDPALPLYVNENTANRLDSSDAAYVEVIHTCAGVLGWADALGHSDFYPNGGTMIQPGCGTDISEMGMGACSHNRCPPLFAESITTKKGFVGIKCSDWLMYQAGQCSSNEKALMGDKTPTSAKGTYFLKTASSSPYAEG